MNESIAWLYLQSVGEIPKGAAVCYLCGTSCQEQYTVTKGLADTFNSHYLAQCPSSLVLCPACYWYFDGKAGHPDFRKMSLVVARDRWRNWQRVTMKADIERWLTDGLDADAYLVVSLSKKKHILLQAPLNASSRAIALQVEECVAYLTYADWKSIDSAFMQLLSLGHGKGEILSGALYASTLRKHGNIGLALQCSQQLDLWRGSSQLELLSYVTLSENKEEASIDNDA